MPAPLKHHAFANTLFALELDRRLKAAGAHPGYAATNLQTSGPSGVLELFMRIGNRFFSQPSEMGVLPQLYAATAVEPVDAARDEALAERLWRISEELTGVRADWPALSAGN